MIMQRHAFGRGEYQYFKYPLPGAVEALRQAIHPHLAPIANRWRKRLNEEGRFPPSLAAYLDIGSPEEVVEQLTEVATDLNVGHLMLLLQFGSMGKDLAAHNTKLFAERVMPKLRGLFGEWEDRWWPKPMPP
jgi:hypothetical protein